jgi:predicted transcriptional regulator
MTTSIHVRLDDQTSARLDGYLAAHPEVSKSEAVRILLTLALRELEEPAAQAAHDAAIREGMLAGAAKVKKALAICLADVLGEGGGGGEATEEPPSLLRQVVFGVPEP